MSETNKFEKLSWQFSDEENKRIREPLEKIKEKYAKEVSKFIKKLPEEYHKIATLESLDVGYEVTLELTKWRN